MNQLQLHDLLWQVAEGKLSPAQAEKLLHSSADLGFACLDLEREQRCGCGRPSRKAPAQPQTWAASKDSRSFARRNRLRPPRL